MTVRDELSHSKGGGGSGRGSAETGIKAAETVIAQSAPVALEVAGVEIGHWTDYEARTGCTVIVLPPETVAAGEVRGGAPATREFALLDPQRLVEHVDAIVLTGGSAFGLAAADGVMETLEAEGRGFETAHGRVPIVVAMALYDLGVGSASVRPDIAAGRQAASQRAATSPTGRIGAGTGATVAKWLDPANPASGGLGVAVARSRELAVCAVVAVNAAGTPDEAHATAILEQAVAASVDLPQPLGRPLTRPAQDAARDSAISTPPEAATRRGSPAPAAGPVTSTTPRGGPTTDEPTAALRCNASPVTSTAGRAGPMTNTTLCAIVTNGMLSKLDCFWVAQGGHDGLARSLLPAHTRSDGDAVVVAATGETPCDPDDARLLAVAAVVKAVRQAVS